MARNRLGLFAVGLSLILAASTVPAPADLFMTIGEKRAVQNAPFSDCSTKAKSALDSVLHNAFGSEDGAVWLAYDGPDNSESGTIHCFPVGNGYLVTFTCAVQVPPSPTMAADLCTKLSAAFGGKESS